MPACGLPGTPPSCARWRTAGAASSFRSSAASGRSRSSSARASAVEGLLGVGRAERHAVGRRRPRRRPPAAARPRSPPACFGVAHAVRPRHLRRQRRRRARRPRSTTARAGRRRRRCGQPVGVEVAPLALAADVELDAGRVARVLGLPLDRRARAGRPAAIAAAFAANVAGPAVADRPAGQFRVAAAGRCRSSQAKPSPQFGSESVSRPRARPRRRPGSSTPRPRPTGPGWTATDRGGSVIVRNFASAPVVFTTDDGGSLVPRRPRSPGFAEQVGDVSTEHRPRAGGRVGSARDRSQPGGRGRSPSRPSWAASRCAGSSARMPGQCRPLRLRRRVRDRLLGRLSSFASAAGRFAARPASPAGCGASAGRSSSGRRSAGCGC